MLGEPEQYLFLPYNSPTTQTRGQRKKFSSRNVHLCTDAQLDYPYFVLPGILETSFFISCSGSKAHHTPEKKYSKGLYGIMTHDTYNIEK